MIESSFGYSGYVMSEGRNYVTVNFIVKFRPALEKWGWSSTFERDVRHGVADTPEEAFTAIMKIVVELSTHGT